MSFEENEIEFKHKKKKVKKKRFILGYFLLFAIVFLCALFTFMYFVKSYSPDVDVAIGNNEAMTLTESEMDFEIKTVDERLKWIQLEDEMPSVALRNSKADIELEKITSNSSEEKIKKDKEKDINKKSKETEKKEVSEKEKHNIDLTPKRIELSDAISGKKDFRKSEKEIIIPPPIPTLTKVYLGNYSSIDDATAIQRQVGFDFPEISPFVKHINGAYVVQLSSFSNKEKANIFVERLREKGYKPKIQTTN